MLLEMLWINTYGKQQHFILELIVKMFTDYVFYFISFFTINKSQWVLTYHGLINIYPNDNRSLTLTKFFWCQF